MSSRTDYIVAVSAMAIAAATFGARPANAQTDAIAAQAVPEPAPDEALDARAETDIVVTGSRIRRQGMASPTPVTELTADDLNAIAPGGVADALDKLPSFLNSPSTSGDSTSGVSDAGGTNLNLRGLGTARTLTLLSGRRVVPNNKEGAVNIDILPQAVMKRVDVVTGGASAAYGTDAVAGVVNFVLDTEFTGIKGGVQGGISKRGDNRNGKAELSYGADIGDRFHVILSGLYSAEDGIDDYSKRNWYQGWSLIINPNKLAGGSGQGPTFIRARDVVSGNFTCGGLIASPNAQLNRLEFLPDGSVAPYVRSSVSSIGAGSTNAQSLAGSGGSGCDPKRSLQDGTNGPSVSADHQRANLFAYADYDLSDNVKLFGQVLWSHDQADIGPSSVNMATPYNATIFSGNPFLPASVQQVMTANNIASFQLHRENGDIFTDNTTIVRNRSFLVTGGVDATLANGGFMDGWSVNAYGQYSQNQQRASFYGKERQHALYIALDAVRDPNGNPVCRAALLNPSRFGDCVPINLFGAGNASASAIDYVTTPRRGEPDAIIFHYNLKQVDAEISTSGEVFSGWGAGPISAAFGANYRKQEVTSFQTGLSTQIGSVTNATTGVRGLPPSISGDPDAQLFDSFSDVEGSLNVKEAFAELDIPILNEVPFFRKLTANLAVRYADYSGSGSIWAYKAGLDWQVDRDVRLRGTYSRDVRAASLSERFDSQRTNGSVSNDPVTGQTYNFSQTTGGNPNVAPEKADTFTAGVVVQPSWFRGLAVSVDYYNVKIKGAINQLGTQRIVDQCAGGSTELCALITRDPQTGLITDLRNVFINIAEETASGMDVEVDYRTPLALLGGDESLMLRGLASLLFDRTLVLPGSGKAILDGQMATQSSGDDFAYPHLQMTGNLIYKNGPVSVTLQERYIGGGKLNNTYVEGINVDDNDVKPAWYTDLGLTYRLIDNGAKSVELFGYITNLFDKSPPLAPEPWTTLSGSIQTNKQLYDFIGQRFLAGVRFEF